MLILYMSKRKKSIEIKEYKERDIYDIMGRRDCTVTRGDARKCVGMKCNGGNMYENEGNVGEVSGCL